MFGKADTLRDLNEDTFRKLVVRNCDGCANEQDKAQHALTPCLVLASLFVIVRGHLALWKVLGTTFRELVSG
jgi:hypothetical protein